MIILCLIGDKMKRFNKILSLILCLTLLFTSCAKSSEKTLDEIKGFMSQKQYNECYQYLTSLKAEEFAEVIDDIEPLLITEFNALTEKEKVDLTNPYILTEYTSNYTENCRKLWNIASLLNITPENANFTTFAYMRYFSESNDFMRFRELYLLMSRVYENGYIGELHSQLNEYDANGDFSNFESLYNEIQKINYNDFNPQEFQIEEFKTSHDALLKALHSLCNGFATNDSTVVASSINDIYDSLTTVLNLTNTLKSVRANQIAIYTELFDNKNINKNFNIEIANEQTQYTLTSDFGFEYLFQDNKSDLNSPSNNQEITTNADKPQIGLKDTIKIIVNAITKTKNFKKNVTVSLKESTNIVLIDFKTDTKINSANEITKTQINNMLDQANTTTETVQSFSSGKSKDGSKLFDFLPPKNASPTINESDVESYSATSGSGGYVITINLKSTSTNILNPTSSISTIASEFKFDSDPRISDFKTYYSPTTMTFIIDNSGLLSKMEYSINGVSECVFNSNDKFINTEFDFTEKYSYSFTY